MHERSLGMNERLSGDRKMKLAPLKFRYEYKCIFCVCIFCNYIVLCGCITICHISSVYLHLVRMLHSAQML